jgi:hypothetical protein
MSASRHLPLGAPQRMSTAALQLVARRELIGSARCWRYFPTGITSNWTPCDAMASQRRTKSVPRLLAVSRNESGDKVRRVGPQIVVGLSYEPASGTYPAFRLSLICQGS